MDPDGKWISTRAVLLAAAGQNCWPPAGSYMAATGQDLMAADTRIVPTIFYIIVITSLQDTLWVPENAVVCADQA